MKGWHGLNHEQWMKLFDGANWREHIARALYTIALSADAACEDRLLALQTLNAGILDGMLPADPGYPAMMRDILLEISTGATPRTSWFGRRRRRKRLNGMLVGVRWTLQTVDQFPAPPPEPGPHAADVDTSRFS